MPVAIRRIDQGRPSEDATSLERYVASRVWARLKPLWVVSPTAPEILVDADAHNIGGDWSITVFVSDPKAVDAARESADQTEDELRAERISAAIKVVSWTGPWD
jgi:hypothetical protein